MITQIEKEVGSRVAPGDLLANPTIRQLGALLKSDVGVRQGAVVTPLHLRGDKTPLVLAPSMTGSPFFWDKLQSHLGDNRPLFALSPRDSASWSRMESLPDIAGHCVDGIVAALPDGRVHLAGYSFGGRLAFEIARQLTAANHSVETVVLIDSTPPLLYPRTSLDGLLSFPNFLANLPRWLVDNVLRSPPTQFAAEVRRKLRVYAARTRRFFSSNQSTGPILDTVLDTSVLNEEAVPLLTAGLRASQSYVPGKYKGHVALLRAVTRPLYRNFKPEKHWHELVEGQFDVIRIPGTHVTILEKESGTILGQEIARLLDERDEARVED